MLANGMPPYDQLTAEGVDEPRLVCACMHVSIVLGCSISGCVCRFYSALIALMSHKYKDVFAATAEVLGLALAFMESNHEVGACILSHACMDMLQHHGAFRT